MTDTTIPFRFEDLPLNYEGKRVEPESWGPIYSKPQKPGRKPVLDNWPTNAPSGQKTAHVCSIKLRAKIRAEFQALDNKQRADWAAGKPRVCGYEKTETIYEAYAQAMAKKWAKELSFALAA